MADESTVYDWIENTGLVVTDTSELQDDVTAEYQDALGSNISTDESTPQGVMITAETLARKKVANTLAAMANQINPNQAEGVFLEAICALSGYEVPSATYSTISGVTVTGVASTTIPEGSEAESTNGDIFETTADVTLDDDGTGTVDFQAAEAGVVSCAAGELTTVVSDVLGWETVTNSNAAVEGTDELTDAEIRTNRKATLAIQGTGTGAAIESHLADLDGYITHQYLENSEATGVTLDDVVMVANSIWVCVQGPTDADIGAALLQSKAMGCAWNGDESVTVTDDSSGQDYTVLFDRPTEVPIGVKITVVPGTSSTDASSEVKSALLDYVFKVGDNVSPWELAATVNDALSDIYIRSLTISTIAADSYSSSEIDLAIYELATLASGNITVTVESE